MLLRPVTIAIADMRLNSVTFGGGVHAISEDPGGNDQTYSSQQWLDVNMNGNATDAGDHLWPVAYTRSDGSANYLHVSASWQLDRAWTGGAILVRATTSAGIDIPSRAATVVGTTVSLADTAATTAFTTTVRDYDRFEIDWEASSDGGNTWTAVGTSSNELYLTLHNPTVSPLYHTVVYLGSHSASGQDSDSGVLSSTWTGTFATKAVHRVDGKLLTYYGYRDNNSNGAYDQGVDDNFNDPTRCTVTDTAGLLQSRNGQCHSWAQLMQDVLNAQGIASDIVAVVIKSPYDAFAIKSWATSGTTYPKFIISDDAGVDGSTPATPNPGANEAADATGASGQGTSPNPPSMFANHFIVNVNGSYYDPSYALGGYTDRKDYEDAAFAGRVRVNPPGLPAGLYLYTLPANDHDPNTTDDLICSYT